MDELHQWEDDVGFARYLVRRIVKETSWPLDSDDLEGEALLALCECRKRFQSEYGIQFKTFAYQRIRGSVLDCMRRKLKQVGRESGKGWREEKSEAADFPWDSLPCCMPTPFDRCEQRSSQQKLINLVAGLNANQRDVVRLIYFTDQTSQEVRESLGGRSRSWISRYHANALDSLRSAIEQNHEHFRV